MSIKHSYEDRLKYMALLEDGYSYAYIHRTYGINSELLKALHRLYLKYGVSALQKKTNIKADYLLKQQAIIDFEEKHLSLVAIMLKYGVSDSAFRSWRKKYHNGSLGALSYDNRGKKEHMGRPRKKKPEEMTELERLRYENECLRAENALLKKVKALVEEREARLREIGRKPSKN
jgi:transposase-like protein